MYKFHLKIKLNRNNKKKKRTQVDNLQLVEISAFGIHLPKPIKYCEKNLTWNVYIDQCLATYEYFKKQW